jgi:5-methylcytosine-specific restriction endonuclease McrA
MSARALPSVRVFLLLIMDYEHFYGTAAWKKCRAAYYSYRGGLCERCYANGMIVPGKVVHHKHYLNDDTVNDSELSMNFDNLELLCWSCHEKEHGRWVEHRPRQAARRYIVDENGKVITAPHKNTRKDTV